MAIKNIIDKEIFEIIETLNSIHTILSTPIDYLESRKDSQNKKRFLHQPNKEIITYLKKFKNLQTLVVKQNLEVENFKQLINYPRNKEQSYLKILR